MDDTELMLLQVKFMFVDRWTLRLLLIPWDTPACILASYRVQPQEKQSIKQIGQDPIL